MKAVSHEQLVKRIVCFVQTTRLVQEYSYVLLRVTLCECKAEELLDAAGLHDE